MGASSPAGERGPFSDVLEGAWRTIGGRVGVGASADGAGARRGGRTGGGSGALGSGRTAGELADTGPGTFVATSEAVGLGVGSVTPGIGEGFHQNQRSTTATSEASATPARRRTAEPPASASASIRPSLCASARDADGGGTVVGVGGGAGSVMASRERLDEGDRDEGGRDDGGGAGQVDSAELDGGGQVDGAESAGCGVETAVALWRLWEVGGSSAPGAPPSSGHVGSDEIGLSPSAGGPYGAAKSTAVSLVIVGAVPGPGEPVPGSVSEAVASLLPSVLSVASGAGKVGATPGTFCMRTVSRGAGVVS